MTVPKESTPLQQKRYLFDQINWDARAICIYGDRGVGKTTMMCQRLVERYQVVEHALYLSADTTVWNILVIQVLF